MNELFLDYVIYNPTKDYVIRWEYSGDIVIYGDKEEAKEDCIENDEIVIQCSQLPEKYKNELIFHFQIYSNQKNLIK